MMKKFFFLAIAAAAMASCSQDETIGVNQGQGISFRSSTDKATRSMETTTANLTSFYVTAFDDNGAGYFKDANFTGSQGESYTSNPAYYWPGDDDVLTFRAYAPVSTNIDGTMSLSKEDGNTLTDFTPKNDVSEQVDLIYATATGKKSENETSGVQLNFAHMLSQIEIKAKNANEGYIYKVMGVKIGKVVSKGMLNFDKAVSDDATTKASAWTPGSEKADYTVEYETGSEIELDENATSIMLANNDNAMLIPQQLTAWDSETDNKNESEGAYLAVKVNIETKDGALVYPATKDEYAWAAVAIDTEWEMGNKYTYTLDFSEGAGNVDPEDPDKPGEEILGGPIKFTVSVAEWTPNDEPINLGQEESGK